MIWQACEGESHICLIEGDLCRIVESQEQVATLSYVDTLEEQALLESLLDEVKPPFPSQQQSTLHYLLSTPFRYPPLQWGSRFGNVNEPSLFYGGVSLSATLSEAAYYRFVFWFSMSGPAPASVIHTQHTLFSAGYRTTMGLRLQASPFSQYHGQLRHPSDYAATQTLGSEMRSAGLVAFEYTSARDPQKGVCVGLFSAQAFTNNEPHHTSRWLCEISAAEASFKRIGEDTVYRFPLEAFCIDGKLPLPA